MQSEKGLSPESRSSFVDHVIYWLSVRTLDINLLLMYTSFYISDEKDDSQAGKVNIIGKWIILYSTYPLKMFKQNN